MEMKNENGNENCFYTRFTSSADSKFKNHSVEELMLVARSGPSIHLQNAKLFPSMNLPKKDNRLRTPRSGAYILL